MARPSQAGGSMQTPVDSGAAEPAPAMMDAEGLSSALQIALPDRGALLSGRAHLLDIGLVKTRLGGRWEALRERITLIAEGILGNYLGRRDLYSRIGETAFLVVFMDLDQDEGQIKCGLILKHLLERLLGAGEPIGELKVRTIVGMEQGVVRTITVDPIKKVMAGHGGAGQPKSAAKGPAAQIDAPTPGQLQLPPDIDFVYLPMWNCRRKAITTYRCLPRSSHHGRAPKLGYSLLLGAKRSTLVSELDLLVLARAQEDGAHMLRNNRRAMIAVMVHAETLRHARHSQSYRLLCERLPPALRELLAFEIVGLERGAARSRIGVLAGQLRPFCRSIFVRCDGENEVVERLRFLGIDGLSLFLGSRTEPEAELFGVIDRFAVAGRQSRFMTAIHGLRSRSLAMASIAAGIDHIDGEAIGAEAQAPETMQRFEILDLYRN